MFFYNRSVGTKIRSAETMKATAMDSMSDSIATTADPGLDGDQRIRQESTWTDGADVWLHALFLYAGYGAAKDTLNPLLGGTVKRICR